ncbi:MAG: Rrf2 family transcriptional regulator [Deltaproteobacteria bacterium]|nr:Rrf2 family transcriptional regulator [Deltaproteobacteria bacterium]
MKLSTRSRYGTRMVLALAEHFQGGPVQIGEIAKQLDISVKYLEQLIIPLKKAGLIKSVRGPKGGHALTKSPDEITVGEIVKILEGGIDLSDCIADPAICNNTGHCVARGVWQDATKAMYDKLNSVTFSYMIEMGKSL